MCITAAVIAAIMTNEAAAMWITGDGRWVMWPLLVVIIGIEIAILCYPKVRQMVPLNYILLFIFTVAFGLFASMNCVVYGYENPETIAAAAGLTVLITVAVSAYACYTKTDFTICGGLIFILSFALTGFLLISWILGIWLNTLFCTLIIILYGIFLIYDTQLIIGKGRHKMGIDDYVAGAMILYIDIIMIFTYLLSLMGGN